MSQPKRYYPMAVEVQSEMIDDNDGDWVRYSDYAALAAENERLRQHLEFFRGKFDAKSNRLVAQILKDAEKFAAKEGSDAK